MREKSTDKINKPPLNRSRSNSREKAITKSKQKGLKGPPLIQSQCNPEKTDSGLDVEFFNNMKGSQWMSTENTSLNADTIQQNTRRLNLSKEF